MVVVLPARHPPPLTATPAAKQRKLGAGTAGVATSPASATPISFVTGAGSSSSTNTEMTRVVLVDMENKLVAYTGTFEGGVRDAISAWGHVYVVGNDGNVGIMFFSSELFANRIAVFCTCTSKLFVHMRSFHICNVSLLRLRAFLKSPRLRNSLCYTKRTSTHSRCQLRRRRDSIPPMSTGTMVIIYINEVTMMELCVSTSTRLEASEQVMSFAR